MSKSRWKVQNQGKTSLCAQVMCVIKQERKWKAKQRPWNVAPRLICYLWLEIHPKNWPGVSALGSALLPSEQVHASARHGRASACPTMGRCLEALWVTLVTLLGDFWVTPPPLHFGQGHANASWATAREFLTMRLVTNGGEVWRGWRWES